jgi:hypothetical protein
VAVLAPAGDDLETSLEAYLQLAVTTTKSSRAEAADVAALGLP